MRKTLVVVLSLAAGFSAASAAPAASTDTAVAEATAHKVVEGDTLWDIADHYYRNPRLWSRIWDSNRASIDDPDRIFPSQVFSIPSSTETSGAAPVTGLAATPTAPAPADEAVTPAAPAAVTAEAVPASAEAVPAVPALLREEPVAVPAPAPAPVRGGDLGATAGIVSGDWEIDATIVGDPEDKLMISTGDTVYLDTGDGAVVPGTRCSIYRKVGEATDPATGKVLGFEVIRVGALEVTECIGEQTCSARITETRDPIKIGDVVRFSGDAEQR